MTDTSIEDSEGAESANLFSISRDDVLKPLVAKLDDYLRKRRKPVVRQNAVKLVETLKKEGAFPVFSSNTWDQHRERDLEAVIKDIYEAEPRIFNSLNIQQKKTMVHLFSLVMDSSQRETLLDVLEKIVSLEKKGFGRPC